MCCRNRSAVVGSVAMWAAMASDGCGRDRPGRRYARPGARSRRRRSSQVGPRACDQGIEPGGDLTSLPGGQLNDLLADRSPFATRTPPRGVQRRWKPWRVWSPWNVWPVSACTHVPAGTTPRPTSPFLPAPAPSAGGHRGPNAGQRPCREHHQVGGHRPEPLYRLVDLRRPQVQRGSATPPRTRRVSGVSYTCWFWAGAVALMRAHPQAPNAYHLRPPLVEFRWPHVVLDHGVDARGLCIRQCRLLCHSGGPRPPDGVP